MFTMKLTFEAEDALSAFALANDVHALAADHYEDRLVTFTVTEGDATTDADHDATEAASDEYDRQSRGWKAEHSVTLNYPVTN